MAERTRNLKNIFKIQRINLVQNRRDFLTPENTNHKNVNYPTRPS